MDLLVRRRVMRITQGQFIGNLRGMSDLTRTAIQKKTGILLAKQKDFELNPQADIPLDIFMLIIHAYGSTLAEYEEFYNEVLSETD